MDKIKSADIRESISIESMFLRLERSELRWLSLDGMQLMLMYKYRNKQSSPVQHRFDYGNRAGSLVYTLPNLKK